MSSQQVPSLAAMETLIASVGFPVRPETLERAWAATAERPTPGWFQERVRRTLTGDTERNVEVNILVTLRAKPGRERELEQAALEFVDASLQLAGSLGSTLYRSADDPLTLTLVERFASEEAFGRHMASDYFRRFQVIQAPLLDAPPQATFLERIERET